MSWPLWEDKKEKASRLLSFLFHFLHHHHPHPNNHCNYQPVSFDNFESLSWKQHWPKDEMQFQCSSLSCFVKATNCEPNTSFPLCLQYFSPKEKVSPCFVFFVVYIEGQSPWQWTEPVRAFRQTRSDFLGFYLSFMAEPCSDVFCISPATNIRMPDIAGTKISNWTWLLILVGFSFLSDLFTKQFLFCRQTWTTMETMINCGKNWVNGHSVAFARHSCFSMKDDDNQTNIYAMKSTILLINEKSWKMRGKN